MGRDDGVIQGCTKRLFPGCVKMGWKNCVLLPAVGKQNATFSPNFTKPGKSLLEVPCTSVSTNFSDEPTQELITDGVTRRSDQNKGTQRKNYSQHLKMNLGIQFRSLCLSVAAAFARFVLRRRLLSFSPSLEWPAKML